MNKTILAIILSILAAGPFVISWVTMNDESQPLYWKAVNRDFPEMNLNDYKNGSLPLQFDQTTAVHLFASWCSVCKKDKRVLHLLEMPVYGIAWGDTSQKLNRYFDGNTTVYDKIYYDPNSNESIKLGLDGVPYTYIVSPNGKILYKNRGGLTVKRINEIKEILQNQI